MSVRLPDVATESRSPARSWLYALGIAFTVAAGGVEAWLAVKASYHRHPVAIALALVFLLVASAAIVGMWYDLVRAAGPGPAMLTCSRCGQRYLRCRREGRSRWLVVLGLRSYDCRLCSHRFVASASVPVVSVRAQDQREYLRLPARLPVRCLGVDRISDAVIRDISMGGCRLETEAHFAPGTILFVEFGAPQQGHAVAVRGTVLRPAGPRAYALQFQPPKDRLDRERFRWSVQRLLAAPPAV